MSPLDFGSGTRAVPECQGTQFELIPPLKTVVQARLFLLVTGLCHIAGRVVLRR
jgi:hypothetical protein